MRGKGGRKLLHFVPSANASPPLLDPAGHGRAGLDFSKICAIFSIGDISSDDI
jgi:hypothetical protein